MVEQSTLDTIKAIYTMWATGDGRAVPTLMEHLSEDIKWSSLANGCSGLDFTRECNCKDDVMQYFIGLVANWELVHFTVNEFVSERDRIIMLGHCCFLHRQSGKQVETPKIDAFRVRQGLIVEFSEFYDTAAMQVATQ